MYNAIDFCILILINSSDLPVEFYFLYTQSYHHQVVIVFASSLSRISLLTGYNTVLNSKIMGALVLFLILKEIFSVF